jgi:hypothetical protein
MCRRAPVRCPWNEMLRISDEECPSEERGSTTQRVSRRPDRWAPCRAPGGQRTIRARDEAKRLVREAMYAPTRADAAHCIHGPLLWTISEVCWTTKHGTSTARDVRSLCILDGNRKRSARQPGVVSASIHRGADGTHVAAYSQWRRVEDFNVLRGTPEMQEHMRSIAAFAKFEAVLYEVASVRA